MNLTPESTSSVDFPSDGRQSCRKRKVHCTVTILFFISLPLYCIQLALTQLIKCYFVLSASCTMFPQGTQPEHKTHTIIPPRETANTHSPWKQTLSQHILTKRRHICTQQIQHMVMFMQTEHMIILPNHGTNTAPKSQFKKG